MPGSETVRMNLWLVQGEPPADSEPTGVRIAGFAFAAGATAPPIPGAATVLDFSTVATSMAHSLGRRLTAMRARWRAGCGAVLARPGCSRSVESTSAGESPAMLHASRRPGGYLLVALSGPHTPLRQPDRSDPVLHLPYRGARAATHVDPRPRWLYRLAYKKPPWWPASLRIHR